MQFLKGLFWFLLAVVVAVFVIGNWSNVPIRLWGGMIADVNLPLLLLVFFLLGLVPSSIWHHAIRWRMRQRLASAERNIAEIRSVPVVETPAPVPPALL